MIARVTLALLACLVLAWLGVMERDTRLQARGLASVHAGRIGPGIAELRRARLINPDPTPDLLRALSYLRQGQRKRSTATIEAVLRREPRNLPAWADLLVIARGHDPGAATRALAALRQLDPLSFQH